METPVLLLVYNRLSTVKRVLREINKAQPEKIYIAGDGPKQENPQDSKKVEEVRNYILANIDEGVEIQTLFHSENLGAGQAVYKGLKWFFSYEERGIILEDDCLPADGFFKYCEELLNLYEDHQRIGMITGRNELGRFENNIKGDYFLSTRAFVWGWATWKDRIEFLDIEIEKKITLKKILTIFKNTSSFLEFIYRLNNIKQLKARRVDAWDYQWSICLLLHSKYTIVPKKNMIRNIGFGEISTHKFESNIDKVECFDHEGDVQNPVSLSLENEYTHKTVLKHTGGLLRVLVPEFVVNFIKWFK